MDPAVLAMMSNPEFRRQVAEIEAAKRGDDIMGAMTHMQRVQVPRERARARERRERERERTTLLAALRFSRRIVQKSRHSWPESARLR
jgi:hypothetical protein